MKLKALIILIPLLTMPVRGDTFGSGANQFSIDFVTIGNAGNAHDDTGYGSVGYTYQMGVNEVSRGMINAYNTLSGGQKLNLFDMTYYNANGVNHPATGISWNEAARFVNWLNTSKGYSPAYKFTTDGYKDHIALWTSADAGYNPANPFRNAKAYYFLPSEDEWYKAAYYDANKSGGAGYWNYATGSDTQPVETSGGTASASAVYRDGVSPDPSGPAEVKNAGGLSPYGTMAQSGNVTEWIESAFTAPNDSVSEYRVLRGGHWRLYSNLLASSSRYTSFYPQYIWSNPDSQYVDVGFRVAALPEASGALMILTCMMGALLRRNR